jgi:hypothetical protein
MDRSDRRRNALIREEAANDAGSEVVDGATQTDDIGDELYCSTREAGCHVVIGVPGLGIEPPGTSA